MEVFADGRFVRKKRFKQAFQPFMPISAIYFGKGLDYSEPEDGSAALSLTEDFATDFFASIEQQARANIEQEIEYLEAHERD